MFTSPEVIKMLESIAAIMAQEGLETRIVPPGDKYLPPIKAPVHRIAASFGKQTFSISVGGESMYIVPVKILAFKLETTKATGVGAEGVYADLDRDKGTFISLADPKGIEKAVSFIKDFECCHQAITCSFSSEKSSERTDSPSPSKND